MKRSICLVLAYCYLMVAAKTRPLASKRSAARQIGGFGVGGVSQDPTDYLWTQKLQLAIENVDETFSTPPDFTYSPIDQILEVETGVLVGEGTWYTMQYTTPNGWFSYGTSCSIDFAIMFTRDIDPTYKDVRVDRLQCFQRQ